VKVWRLPLDPGQEARQFGPLAQDGGLVADPRKLRVGEIGMDRAMADWVERDGRSSAAALGLWMVALDPMPEGTET